MLSEGPIHAVGAMSGTSLDGVDVAVIETDGHDILGFGPTAYRPYTPREQATLRGALGRWPEDGSPDDLAAVRDVVHAAHRAALEHMPGALVGFHGQTLAHDPGGRGTHQLGNGAALAHALGRPVVWDFRSEDVAKGGQGAPLAPFYHFACARFIKATAPLAFLNLGGVGNLTWVDPTQDTPEHPDALLAFDTGPANAPLNDLMQARRGQSHDANGALAARGTPHQEILKRFRDAPYFRAPPPKSLDRDDFADVVADVEDLPDADAAATICAMIAASVQQGLSHLPRIPSQILVCGGGRHNPVILKMLADAVPCAVQPVEAVGLNGDMLEAQAFAYLAVRSARGLPISSPTTTGAPRPLTGGRLSMP